VPERFWKLQSFMRFVKEVRKVKAPAPTEATRRMPDGTVPDFERILGALVGAGVDFIIVGGLAATAHGSARAMYDVEVVYARGEHNIRKLAAALLPHRPYPRGAPPGLPFQWDEGTVERGLNFTLSTDLGDLDLLGEITAGGRYEDLLPFARKGEILGSDCLYLELAKLIEVKRAAGRPRDLEAVAELEAILEERHKREA